MPPLKVRELMKFHTDFATSQTLYTSTFIPRLNKREYQDTMPADLKEIIESVLGQGRSALKAGKMRDRRSRS